MLIWLAGFKQHCKWPTVHKISNCSYNKKWDTRKVMVQPLKKWTIQYRLSHTFKLAKLAYPLGVKSQFRGKLILQKWLSLCIIQALSDNISISYISWHTKNIKTKGLPDRSSMEIWLFQYHLSLCHVCRLTSCVGQN